MNKPDKTNQQLLDEVRELTSRTMEAEETLRAIMDGEVDGLVVSTAEGDRVFTLSGADLPYRVMVETMNEGAVTLASDGTILFCNRRFEDIVKGAPGKVTGSSIYRYISSTNLQLFEVLLERGLKGNSKAELALQTEGEHSVPVLLSISALQHTDTPGAMCVVVTDLTEQKLNEEMRVVEKALQKAYDMLEQKVEERTAELVAAREDAENKRQTAEAALSEIKTLKEQLEAERAYLQEEIELEYNHETIIGQSDGLKYVLYKVEQIAVSDTTVLVLGETGAGKELVARAIHALSSRKNRALIKVNCATLPSNLIESELFGHEKGAFTGSQSRHLGRFEVADGTTLFLDEIGELPLELQAKLLRVIQDGEFERLGGSSTIKVNARIIAATNRNLEKEVREGRFREDLWYRLNVFPITMPPLRDRMDDIPLLVDFYVKKISRRMGKTIEIISESVMTALQDYHWPGNIRELENVLERAVINSSGPKLHLVDELKKPSGYLKTSRKTLEAVERDHIVRTLEQTHWKVGGKNSAAEILGLDRSTLRARMRKLDIQKP